MEFDAEMTACARGSDMRCSPKASRNIARTIKGMRLDQAKVFLEEVIEKKTAVPYTVRYRKIKHRRGAMGPGAFPVKAAGHVLDILKNAENNAQYKDLETDNLRIVHASAYRGFTFPGWRPRAHGRASQHNEQTTNLEIVLGEDADLDTREEARLERQSKGGKGGKKPVKAASSKPKAAPKADKEAAPKAEKPEAEAKKEPETKAEPKAKAEAEPKAAAPASDEKEAA